MKTPGAPRLPLGEVSPNTRSMVMGQRRRGHSYGSIALDLGLPKTTCQGIAKCASEQVSCISNKRTGAPTIVTAGDSRLIFRTLARTPKITAAQLVASTVPHLSKKTIYRFLKKSGVQKWRCKKRPFLKPEHVAARLAWAHLHNGKPIEFWRRVKWSDECSLQRGKGGQIEWVYRRKGKFLSYEFLKEILTFTFDR